MTATVRAARGARAFAGVLALFAASGCTLFHSGPQVASADPAAQGGGTVARSGLAGDADRLLEADRAFAARALAQGAPAAFHEFFTTHGMSLPPAGDPIVGRDAVRAMLENGAPVVLSWEPRFAEVFAPGDWGWTWGDWQAHEPGAGGRRFAQGRYVHLWRKQKDGSWKVRLDMGHIEREPP